MEGSHSSDSPPIHPRIPGVRILRRLGGNPSGDVWMALTQTGDYQAIRTIPCSDQVPALTSESRLHFLQKYALISRNQEHLLQSDFIRPTKDTRLYCVMPLADDISTVIPSTPLARQPAAPAPQFTGTPPFQPDRYLPATLRAILLRQGPLPGEQVLSLGLTLTSALESLHNHGWVHGAITPSKILYINGHPRLAPPAFHTVNPVAYPTADRAKYVPPEGPGTPQTDLFALGKVLAEAMEGPWTDDSGHTFGTLRETPRRQGSRKSVLVKILDRACDPKIPNRYPTASAMRDALSALIKAI